MMRPTHPRLSLAAVLFCSAACADMVTDLTPYGTIVVETRTLSGGPVPGARLTLYNGVRILSVGTSDIHGRHAFEFVPPNEYGIFSGTPEGFVRPQYLTGGPLVLSADGLVIADGSTATVRFEYLKVGPGSILVRVTDTGESPLPGVHLTAYAKDDATRHQVSRGDGTALFEDVPFGIWGVGAEPPYPYAIPPDYSLATDDLLIDAGAALEASLVVDLEVLERCGGTVAVSVKNRDGGQVPGVPLLLYNAFGQLGEGSTDALGVHEFVDVPCRTVGVSIGGAPGLAVEPGPGTGFQEDIVVTQGSYVTVELVVGT